MSVSHTAPRASFVAPTEKYERGNEAQFRRDLERSLVDITAYINRVIVDPAGVAAHASSHASGGSDPVSLAAAQITSGTIASARIAGSYTGITGVGTITAGTWQGTAIAASYIGSHNHAASDVNSGTFADARIAQSNVTQYQAALAIAASQVTTGDFPSAAFRFPSALVLGTDPGSTTNVGTLQLRMSGAIYLNGDGASLFRNDDTAETSPIAIGNFDQTSATLHAVRIGMRFADTAGSANIGAVRLVAKKTQEWTSTTGTRTSSFEIQVRNGGTQPTIQMKVWPAGDVRVGATDTDPNHGTGNLTLDTALYVGSNKVVGARGAAIADASGGVVIDAEARTALNDLLARVRAHGLIAT